MIWAVCGAKQAASPFVLKILGLHILYPAIVITDEGVPFCENDKDVLDIETNIPFMMKQTKFDIRYLVMGVYAYSDTEGKDIEEKAIVLAIERSEYRKMNYPYNVFETILKSKYGNKYCEIVEIY